jgi:glycosyltransferase involved in cell wall biosynthesis
MKLLFIVPEARGSGGGIHTFYRELLPVLARDHDCHVLCGSATEVVDTPRIEQDEHGVTYHSLDHARFEHYRQCFSRYAAFPMFRNHLAAAWALHDIGRALTPDVVEACDWGLLFLPWVLEQTTPTVVQLHGSCGQIANFDPMLGEEVPAALIQAIELASLPLAVDRLTYSSSNQEFWQSYLSMPVSLILPALKAPPKELYRVIDHRFRVFGRFQKWKGIDVMSQALSRLPDTSQIEWYGRDTPYGASDKLGTEAIQEKYPGVIDKKLFRHGPVSQSSVYKLQSSALANIIPSSWDVFNFTVVEAMSSGRPVICSTGAGASDLIEDGISGLLFKAEDTDSLINAMQRLESMTEDSRVSLAARAHHTVCELLNPEKVARERIAHFERCLTQPKAPPASTWLRAWAKPEQPALPDWLMLSQIPLKVLLSKVKQRLWAKIFH